MNKTFLIGRVCNQIQLRYTSNNVPCCTFTLAVSRDYTNQEGQREADFINIQVWKNQAENCNKYLTKGSLIAIIGRIQTRSYDNEKGEKRYVTEVVADKITFLDNKKDGQATETESDTQVPQTDPYADMGKQVSMDDYPINQDDMPF